MHGAPEQPLCIQPITWTAEMIGDDLLSCPGCGADREELEFQVYNEGSTAKSRRVQHSGCGWWATQARLTRGIETDGRGWKTLECNWMPTPHLRDAVTRVWSRGRDRDVPLESCATEQMWERYANAKRETEWRRIRQVVVYEGGRELDTK